MSGAASRRAYIDWMRGLSVLFMIEAHTFDAWTRVADRSRPIWFWVSFVGGMAAPRNPAWSPMLEFGRSSLFVYWIHVELVYGIFTWPIHKRLPIQWTLVAFVVFSALMYAATLLKCRVVANWKAKRPAPAAA